MGGFFFKYHLNMKNQKIPTKLFTLICNNQIDLLQNIVVVIKNLGILTETISQSRTDDPDVVSINIEIAIPSNLIDPTILNLKLIPGVIDVLISYGSVLQVALFRISSRANRNISDILYKYHAQCVSLENDCLTFVQIAKEKEILSLLNSLDGPELTYFSQIPIFSNMC